MGERTSLTNWRRSARSWSEREKTSDTSVGESMMVVCWVTNTSTEREMRMQDTTRTRTWLARGEPERVCSTLSGDHSNEEQTHVNNAYMS